MKDHMPPDDLEDSDSSCPENVTTKQQSKNAEVRAFSEIMMEEGLKTAKLMSNLTNVIQVKKRRFEDMENKYMENKETICKLIAENEKLHQSYFQESKAMKFSIQEHFQWTCNDYGIINLKLDKEEKELQLRSIELKKRENENANKKKKLAKEIDENSTKERLLQEQRKANKNMMKLANVHKRENERLQKKIIVLEKQLSAKQDLESELLNLRKIEDRRRNLKEKEEELESLESLNLMLILQNRISNNELMEARKELIEWLKELPKAGNIGLKRMRELKIKPFIDAVLDSYRFKNETEAKEYGSRLWRMWENHLKDPSSFPFKGFGSELVYKAVMTADCNYEGDMTRELWNFSDSRKATLAEGVIFLLKMWKSAKLA